MSDHNPFVRPRIPTVEQGMLIGFICPACGVLMTPTLETCGCYGCSNCRRHIDQFAYVRATEQTAMIANDAIMGKARN